MQNSRVSRSNQNLAGQEETRRGGMLSQSASSAVQFRSVSTADHPDDPRAAPPQPKFNWPPRGARMHKDEGAKTIRPSSRAWRASREARNPEQRWLTPRRQARKGREGNSFLPVSVHFIPFCKMDWMPGPLHPPRPPRKQHLICGHERQRVDLESAVRSPVRQAHPFDGFDRLTAGRLRMTLSGSRMGQDSEQSRGAGARGHKSNAIS